MSTIRRYTALAANYLATPGYILKNFTWRFPRMPSEAQHIFVVGAPRSGTTLTQVLLAAHSQLFSVQMETGLFGRSNLFHPNRKHFGLSSDELNHLYKTSTDVVHFFDRCTLAIKPADGFRFVEKTPQHVLRIRDLARWFPNSQFVNVIRDGRDCYVSSKSHENIPQRVSAATFASYWRSCVRERWLLNDCPRVIDVRYEELASDPAGQVARLMEFLGLQVESQQLDPNTTGADQRSSRAVFAKLKKKIDSASVGRWEAELSENELADFCITAGTELRQLGYSLRRPMQQDTNE